MSRAASSLAPSPRGCASSSPFSTRAVRNRGSWTAATRRPCLPPVLAIQANARFGPRLVTVGALAVSADCSVTVRDPDPPPGKYEQPLLDKCCQRFSIQFWIITILVVIILIVVFFRKH